MYKYFFHESVLKNACSYECVSVCDWFFCCTLHRSQLLTFVDIKIVHMQKMNDKKGRKNVVNILELIVYVDWLVY